MEYTLNTPLERAASEASSKSDNLIITLVVAMCIIALAVLLVQVMKEEREKDSILHKQQS